MILYYKPTEKTKKLIDIWKKLAEVSEGIFKVAAVNCDESEEICDENDIKLFPTILCFPSASSKPPSEFKIRISLKRLAEFAVKHMDNFV